MYNKKLLPRPVSAHEIKHVMKEYDTLIKYMEVRDVKSSCSIFLRSSYRYFIVKINDEYKLFINPSIVHFSFEKSIYNIKCIFHKDIDDLNIEYSDSIKIRYLHHGKVIKEEYFGKDAAEIQHMFDHIRLIDCETKKIKDTHIG